MIYLEKIKNEHNQNICNSCHNFTASELFDITVRFNNTGGQKFTLCKDCLEILTIVCNNESKKFKVV